MIASDVMTRNVISVAPDATVAQAMRNALAEKLIFHCCDHAAAATVGVICQPSSV